MAKKKVSATGWIPKPRTRRIEPEGEYWAPDDGSEPLWVEVTDNLTFAQCEAIPFGTTVRYDDLWAAIAPHVVAWNVLGQDAASGEINTVPAPAQAGPGVFTTVPKSLSVWIAQELKYGPFRVTPDQKKASTTSGVTESG